MKIRACPTEGQGVNNWTFLTACQLAKRGWSETKVCEYLAQHTTRTGRKADEEIERAIQRAPEWIKTGLAKPFRKWPVLNRAELEKTLTNGVGVAELRAASPVKEIRADQVLPILFPGNPLIW